MSKKVLPRKTSQADPTNGKKSVTKPPEQARKVGEEKLQIGHRVPISIPTEAVGENESVETKLPATEVEYALWFAREFGKVFIYFSQGRSWYEFNGVVWELITEEVVLKRVDDKLAEMLMIAIRNEDNTTVRWCEHLRVEKSLKIIVKAGRKLIMADDPRSKKKINFDDLPKLLNVINGTINLETGALMQHQYDHFFTKVAPVRYVPGAKSKIFEELINRITGGDKTRIEFLQRLAGYILFGHNEEQIFVLLFGKTGSGKSTFVEMFSSLLGDLSWTADVATFTKSKFEVSGSSPKPDLAQFEGCRLVSAAEASADRQLNEGLMKTLTGEKFITARKLHANLKKIRCSFTIVISTNYLPDMTPTDPAIWRRFVVFPFDNLIPESEQDKSFLAKLTSAETLEAFLVWSVEGSVKCSRVGLFPLPEFVAVIGKQHQASLNTVQVFVDTCGVRDSKLITAGDVLLKSYKIFCEQIGVEPISRTGFFRTLTALGFPVKNTNKSRGRVGLGLLSVKPVVTVSTTDKKVPGIPALSPTVPLSKGDGVTQVTGKIPKKKIMLKGEKSFARQNRASAIKVAIPTKLKRNAKAAVGKVSKPTSNKSFVKAQPVRKALKLMKNAA